jgi:hypothetical protein
MPKDTILQCVCYVTPGMTFAWQRFQLTVLEPIISVACLHGAYEVRAGRGYQERSAAVPLLQQPLLDGAQARVDQIRHGGLRGKAEARDRAEHTLLTNLSAGYAGGVAYDPHGEAGVFGLREKRAQLQRDELLDAHAARILCDHFVYDNESPAGVHLGNDSRRVSSEVHSNHDESSGDG